MTNIESDCNLINNNSVKYVSVDCEQEEATRNPSLAEKFRITLAWKNVSYSISGITLSRSVKLFGRSERVILHPQSGELSSGSLMALMGKSGSGKSTLIESLTGRRSKGLQGNITVNIDSEVSSFIDEKRIKIAFIPQAENFLNVLTVSESLLFASKLKNRNRSSLQHSENVNELLKQLKLMSCKNSRVSRCSGGEKKRLSVAMELVNKPNIIVLDEPTSGLDSTSALQCIQLLRKLSKSKNNPLAILVSIHQPSAKLLDEFDKLYLLSHDGRMLYNGYVNELLDYYKQFNVSCPQFHNPGDHALEIASGELGDDVIDAMSEYQISLQIKADKDGKEMTEYPMTSIIDWMKNHSGVSFVHHTSTLLNRSFKTTVRDPMLFYIRLAKNVFVATLLAIIYNAKIGGESGCSSSYNSGSSSFSVENYRKVQTTVYQNLGFLFFAALFALFASMMPVVLVVPNEISVFIRERSNGWYSALSYYISKTVVDIPFLLTFTLIFSLIAYYFTGQINETFRFAGFFLPVFLTSLLGQSVAFFFGAVFSSNFNAAVFVTPLATLPMVLFSGFFIKIEYLPYALRLFAHVSLLKHAFEALIVAVYGFGRCDVSSSSSSNNQESITAVVLRFVDYITKLDLSYESTKPILTTLAIDKNLSLTELDSFDVHFRNFSTTQINLKDIDHAKSIAMQQFDLSDDDFWPNITTLILAIVLFKVVTYFVLMYKSKNRK